MGVEEAPRVGEAPSIGEEAGVGGEAGVALVASPPIPGAGIRPARPRRAIPMHRITANGLEVGYDEHGGLGAGPAAGVGAPSPVGGPSDADLAARATKPVLVMLHGATSSGREDWGSQVPMLAKTFRVLLPDARGHATTRWNVGDGWSSALLVDDLLAFLDALGLDRVHLAGFSMGAHTALAAAARSPERVLSLVLGGISTQPEPRTSVARRLMDPARADREDPAWAAQLAARHDPVQGSGAWRSLLTAIAADIAKSPVISPREIHRIDCPALVAVGDRDPFAPVDHAWGLQRQLRHGRLLVLPDCPHELMVRRTSLFNEALAGFYRAILHP